MDRSPRPRPILSRYLKALDDMGDIPRFHPRSRYPASPDVLDIAQPQVPPAPSPSPDSSPAIPIAWPNPPRDRAA